MRSAAALLLAGLFCEGWLAAATPPEFILSGDAVPRKHSVVLTVDPRRDSFDGEVRIEVDLREAVSAVWVNAKDLIPTAASIEFAGETRKVRTEPVGGEFLGLETDAPIGPGPAVLHIRYVGKLDEKSLTGAYRRKVRDDWYVYTTFTPIEARRAFPCFDDPSFKTPWEIAIRVRGGQQAFSNAREVSRTDESGGWTRIQFAETPPLAAEVVAFAVGPFDVYDGGSVAGTPVRVITPKGRRAEGRFAAEATKDILPRLEAYTGIPYPFGKLDYLALPEGAFGAVENPGLITYLERILLIAPGTETPDKLQAIRKLEAHELSHQWFGDLVTQATWTDVWLSEGFATWLADKILDETRPPEALHMEAVVDRQRIMLRDASERARPVRREAHDRPGMEGVYDRIVYDKGAGVLLMLEGWLGAEPFQQGLRAYLADYREGNASTEDLAAELEKASGKRVAEVLHAFLDTTGIPRVRGEVLCGPEPRVRVEVTGVAVMPVCIRTGGTGKTCELAGGAPREIALPRGSSCPAWAFLNAGATGYYRTEWTSAQIPKLDLSALTSAERLLLVFDLSLLKTGDVVVKSALETLSQDTNPQIAAAAKEALR